MVVVSFMESAADAAQDTRFQSAMNSHENLCNMAY
jgi:hypothetical protein